MPPPAPFSEGIHFSMTAKGKLLITKQLSKAHTIQEYKVLWAGLSSLGEKVSERESQRGSGSGVQGEL